MVCVLVSSLVVENALAEPSAQPPHGQVPVSPALDRHLTDVKLDARESVSCTVIRAVASNEPLVEAVIDGTAGMPVAR